MTDTDMTRLEADASGNTSLSEVLHEAVAAFAGLDDAVRFLASRGFEVTPGELSAAAGRQPDGAAGDGFTALMRFVRRH